VAPRTAKREIGRVKLGKKEKRKHISGLHLKDNSLAIAFVFQIFKF